MADTFSQLQSAAHSGAFGSGSRATVTPEQIRAGNYAKGSVRLHGMPITIETPMFQPRRGKQDGVPWSVTCMAHYGYINGTVGADGDAVDVFVGPVPESQRVFVVNQVNRDGVFDEHKVLLGFADEESARNAYMNSYEKGWTGLGSLTPCSIKQFKFWLKNGDLSVSLEPVDLWKKDEDLSTSDVYVSWDDKRMPVGEQLGDVIASLRRNDTDSLMMDAATMADLVEYLSDGAMLDAMVVEVQKFERKANQLLRVMQMAATGVKADSVEVSKPFKNRGTTQLAMLFTMSDGQTVSVFFHNPDTTPNKLAPTDEMVSWKWVLNKRDITITVAPERGQDLNPREVARRIMKLVEKNSAKFIQANTSKAERDAELEALKADESAKTAELEGLDKQIEDLTAQLAAKKAAPAPAAEPGLFNEPPPAPDTRDNLAKFTDALKAGDVDAALKVVEGIETPAELRTLILQAGFSMGASRTKEQMMTAVGSALVRAAKAGTDGFGLRELDKQPAPAPEDEAVKLKTPGGLEIVVAKTKYRDNEWGVSYASTDIATASSKEEALAIAERVVAADPDNITDMRTAAVPPAASEPTPEQQRIDRLLSMLAGAQQRLAGMQPGDAFYGNLVRDIADMSRQLWDAGYRGPEVSEPAPAPAARPYSEWEGDVLDALADLLEIDRGDADGIAMAQETLMQQLHTDGKTPEEAAAAIEAASAVEPSTPDEEAMLAAHLEERAQAAAEAELALESEDTGEIEAEGRDNTVKTAKGTKLVTGFKVIEASKLVISHETDGTPNPDYPAEIQPRDRARSTSQAWVQKTARNLDPDSLGRTQRADSGAPIVGPDRVVESGNGRAMAVREAYRIGAADEYREWLVENAEYFGVDVAKINRMKAPILVRVRKTAVDRVAFAVEANQDDKLAQTATEKARSDARRLDAAMLAKLADGDLNSAANRDFVAAFLQSLGDAEAAQYLTTDGKPTSSLISRLQAALFAGAYSDDRLLEMTADVAKPEIANIVAALNSAAPDFMRAKELDRIGAEDAGGKVTDSVELSLNQEAVNAIIGATNVLRQAKDAGLGLDEFLRQGDMFGGTDPAVAAMAMFIQQNNRSAKRMGTAFKAMAQFVESENARKQTAGLFGDAPASFTDIVGAANRKLEQEYGEGLFAIDQGDMFAAPAPAPAAPPQPTPPEPDEDDQLKDAKAYLNSLIDGSTDLGSPAEVLARLESIYAQWGEDELKDLFVDASNAFRDYALRVTAEAL